MWRDDDCDDHDVLQILPRIIYLLEKLKKEIPSFPSQTFPREQLQKSHNTLLVKPVQYLIFYLCNILPYFLVVDASFGKPFP